METLPWKIAETQPVVSLATNRASLNLVYIFCELQKAGLVYGPAKFVEAMFPGMSLFPHLCGLFLIMFLRRSFVFAHYKQMKSRGSPREPCPSPRTPRSYYFHRSNAIAKVTHEHIYPSHIQISNCDWQKQQDQFLSKELSAIVQECVADDLLPPELKVILSNCYSMVSADSSFFQFSRHFSFPYLLKDYNV